MRGKTLAFTKANPTKLVDHLVAQIEEAIVSGSYRPGEKLPPSRELEGLLGASRGTLREAFRILTHKGLIEVKAGAKGGAFVRQPGTESVTESLGLLIRQREITIDDLYEFREVVEDALVRQVIKKAGLSDIKELKSLLSEMADLVPLGLSHFRQLLRVERRIRGEFIRVAQSKMYESVLYAIWDNLHSYARLYLPGDEGMPEEHLDDWQTIISAIESRDAETAAAQTRDHLRRFAQHYKNGLERYGSTEPEDNSQ